MIRLKNVHKAFGNNAVLNGVDLHVPKGESMVIIGGSGTGKSVTLKCILGLVKPDIGTITVADKDIKDGDRDALLSRFGMLFQGGALFDSMPVWQNIAFRLVQSGVSTEEARTLAIEKLRRVGLKPDVADRFPAELSGGMQKRVGLRAPSPPTPRLFSSTSPPQVSTQLWQV
jgi:phospholipid/cholesterol/gamma-HCH transport system ATP-binding protein